MEVQLQAAEAHPVLTLAMEVPAGTGMPTVMPSTLFVKQGTIAQRRTRTITLRRTVAIAAVPAIGYIGWRATGPILASLLHAGCTAVSAVTSKTSQLLNKLSAPLKGPVQVAIQAETRKAQEVLQGLSPARSAGSYDEDESEEEDDEEVEQTDEDAFSSAPSSAVKHKRSPLRLETESALSELATLMAKLESLDAAIVQRGEGAAPGDQQTPATTQSRRKVLTKLATDMDCLNAGLVGTGDASTGKKSKRGGSSSSKKAARSKENSPMPVTAITAAEQVAPGSSARHVADDTPPLNMKKIPNTPMLSTGGAAHGQKMRPVLATVDGNTPATATGKPSAAKPPRGGSAAASSAARGAPQQPAAEQPVASTSGQEGSVSGEGLSVSRAAEAKMDDAMATARRMMEAARAKKQAAKAAPPPVQPQNLGFVTPCPSAAPSPVRGGNGHGAAGPSDFASAAASAAAGLGAGPLGFIGRLLPTILDAPGSGSHHGGNGSKAASPCGSSAPSAEKGGRNGGNKFGGALPVAETESLVEEEVSRRVRIATADSMNKTLALEAQVSQLKARVAELLADLAERDDALARDRARWAALRGDPAALAGMSLTELQVLVRGQEEALVAAKEALQRKANKALPHYL